MNIGTAHLNEGSTLPEQHLNAAKEMSDQFGLTAESLPKIYLFFEVCAYRYMYI